MIAQPYGTPAPRPIRRDASRGCRRAVTESPANPDDGADLDEDLAPFLHGAETVQIDLAPYSLTREQVAERYAAAGFTVKPRTVSLYAQQGRLRARKVEAKNGLERYLFDPASVDEDIAKRRQEADTLRGPRDGLCRRQRCRDGARGRCTRCISRTCTVFAR